MAINENPEAQQLEAKIDEVKGQLKRLEAQLVKLSSTVTDTGSEFREFQTKALEGDRSNWAIDALVHRASNAYLESRQFRILTRVAMLLVVIALFIAGVGVTTSAFQLGSLEEKAEKAAQKIVEAEERTERRMLDAENRAIRETDRVINASANLQATIDDRLEVITGEVQGEADEAKRIITGHVTAVRDEVEPATTAIAGHVTAVRDEVEPATTAIAGHVTAVHDEVEPATTKIAEYVAVVGDNLPNYEVLEELKSADSKLGKIVVEWEERIAAVENEGGKLTLINIWQFLDIGLYVFFGVVLVVGGISIGLSSWALIRSGKP